MRQELLRLRFAEQARQTQRKAAVAPVEGQPTGGLKPWREIVTRHPDVASGRYQQAEFARCPVDVSDLPTVDGVASQTEAERRIIEVERKRLGLDDQPGPTLAAVT